MREDLSPLLQRAAAVIVRDVTGSLGERSGSVYRARGAAATTRVVEALVTALVADVATGAARTLRSILRDALNELSEAAISFRDLRLLQEALRADLFVRIEAAGLPLAALRAVEDWFHELTHQCSLYLISQREVLIDRQASEIEVKLAEQRQLSIPIVPIHAGVLVAPLVGNLDAYRAQVLTARVLEVVGHSRARLLLLDVSGVAKIDQEVVDHLLRTTRAVRLLGCEVVLIGIAAEFARTIATLAVDYRDLTVRRSLQDGFAYALATMGLAIAAAR
ncbi:STAS domain-containing protein [Nannocystis sp. SCPEA4]|uniref:STAS domain-containing protein n=1 Tax=Nannocystis sp. SCPEA4 TaxID=2996787 RepID=UPI002271CDC3|nr:STAS domain-containing protein [Nannocystis sp. SCPEA4]MCY1061252.1 STAS domain-containing protein [Nannocystis sp. SCPEA4]